ncbi:dimethylaniline monooxygenase [N-oxide-forming] 5-like protein, partial [Leptotrombidium deliense]
MSDSKKKLICVIGAGSSGITAVKECIDAGFDVICYEYTDGVGGLWRYREEDIEGVPSVTKNTIINTSKEMSAYSDFPPEANYPNYMPNKDMCRYFEQYTEHFNLYPKIRFNHQVINVTFNDDYEKTGKWKVTVFNRNNQQTFEKVFDGVMIASGHHVKPIIPQFPGQEKFKGTIMHSHSYKTWHQFEDKVVVVVGIGNSGGDAA